MKFTFSDIYCSQDVVRTLKGMADSGRVHHAMMLFENDGGGALPVALAYLDYLNGGSRPDVHYTFPITSGTKVSDSVDKLECDLFIKYWNELLEKNPYFMENELSEALGFEKKKGLIGVREGRAILNRLSLHSMVDGWRGVIVYLPERMNTETANMLLKAIEEPAPRDIFIMITHSPEKVIQTITSRCQALRIPPLPRETIQEALTRDWNASPEDALEISQQCGGSLGAAVRELAASEEYLSLRDLFMDFMDKIVERDFAGTLECSEKVSALESREKQRSFCSYAEDCLRKVFLLQQGMADLAVVPSSEDAFYSHLATSLDPRFCRLACQSLDSVAGRLERNVSQKMLFCNLACRLFGAAAR